MLTKAEISRNVERMNNGEMFPFDDSMLAHTERRVKNLLVTLDVFLFGIPNVFGDNNTYTLELFGSKNNNAFIRPTILVNLGTDYVTFMGVRYITKGMRDVFLEELALAIAQDSVNL